MSSLDKGPWTTKLSSAGLVYAFYGKEAIKNIVGTDDQKLVDMVYDKVRRQLCVVSYLSRRTNIALSLGGLAMFVVVQDPGEKKFDVFSCWCVQFFPRWGQSCQNVQIPCHGEENVIMPKCLAGSCWQEFFFDPRNSRHTPNRPDLSRQMVSQEKPTVA